MPRLLRLQLQPDRRLGDGLISVGGFFSSLPYQPHSFTNHNKPTLVSTLTVRVATPRGVISPPPVVTSRLRSLMWLQFKPHQIAAGAAYLAAKFLNMNLASCNDVWHEFQTPPSVLRDVAHQLMELF